MAGSSIGIGMCEIHTLPEFGTLSSTYPTRYSSKRRFFSNRNTSYLIVSIVCCDKQHFVIEIHPFSFRFCLFIASNQKYTYQIVGGGLREREPRIGHSSGNGGRTRHDQRRTVQADNTGPGKPCLALPCLAWPKLSEDRRAIVGMKRT